MEKNEILNLDFKISRNKRNRLSDQWLGQKEEVDRGIIEVGQPGNNTCLRLKEERCPE